MPLTSNIPDEASNREFAARSNGVPVTTGEVGGANRGESAAQDRRASFSAAGSPDPALRTPGAKRSTNFEVLRIIAIIFIVIFHCTYKTGWSIDAMPFGNRLVADSFMMLGEIGVNLFVLISGYFLIRGRFSWRKLILLLIEVMFYNYLSVLAVNNFNLGSFFATIEIHDVFPTVFGVYWFTTAYVLLYLLSPFLAKGFRALGRAEAKRLIVIMLVVWCVIPTVAALGHEGNDAEAFLFFNRFLWMVVLFCIGGYVSVHGVSLRLLGEGPGRCLLLAAAVFGLIVLFMLCVELNPGAADAIGIHSARYFWPPNTVPLLCFSFLLFMVFARIKMPCIGAVNAIASTTLGIYLLHDGALQNRIWNVIFDGSQFVDSPLMALVVLGEAAAVFAVGAAIDLVRKIPERGISHGIEHIEARWARRPVQ